MSQNIDIETTGLKATSSEKTQINELMAKMTIEEKIGQLVLYSSDMDVTGPVLDKDYESYVKAGQVGSIFNAMGADFTRKLQTMAVEETRLGIPLLFGYDVIHGYKTIFPIPLAESCSWDLDLIEITTRISAIEATAVGLHWVFAPMVDIARDPRWGRISESAGEDPFLGSLISKARVRGFQGNISDDDTVLACAKHFAAYGAAQAGRDYHTVDMSETLLRNVFLQPFKAALDEGVATFMTAFNELNGIPATGNTFLLTDILRNEWNFDGFVVTDYTSINEMVYHGYAKDLAHAGELAINAGTDMDLQGGVFKNNLQQSIEDGRVSAERIDDAVRAVLKMKLKLGLFENPYKYCNSEKEKDKILCQSHLELARDAARKSMVLLKNDNATLPLTESQNIALIGPLADDTFHILGNWVGQGHDVPKDTIVSVAEGFSSRKTHFKYAKGCEIEGGNKDGFLEALQITKDSDVVVMIMGEAEHMSGEAACRTDISLPGHQRELIAEVKKLEKPLVLVLMNGRPLDLSWESQTVDAILEAWYPGTKGGHAIADVLFGDYNPSGKLTATFPKNVGQIPLYYGLKNTGRPITNLDVDPRYTSKYIDEENTPLYPFGFGLSYTMFTYNNVALSTTVLYKNTSLTASADITNSGDVDGEEIAQLYIHDIVGSITRPVKELKGFRKIFLKKGETKKVSFEITANDLMFYNNAELVGESGEFQLCIAGCSDHHFTHKFYLNLFSNS